MSIRNLILGNIAENEEDAIFHPGATMYLLEKSLKT